MYMTVMENDSQKRWDEYFLKMTALVATKSKDPSTQSGCVIVGPDHEVRSTGYNGLPRNCTDGVAERDVRPIKYLWYEHAERNAVYNAARHGVALAGCTAYINWHPCADCARGLIQAGIVRIVTFETPEELKERWGDHIVVSSEMLSESGVVYVEYPSF